MTKFVGVRKLRIEVGIARKKVALVGEGHVGTQVIVDGASNATAVAQLECIFCIGLVVEVPAGKKVGIGSRIRLRGFHQSGLNVGVLRPQTCLVVPLCPFICQDAIDCQNILVIEEDIV